MIFYDRKPPQILVDLINESNPDLGIGLRQLENTRLTVPKPYPTNRNDGKVRVVKGFTGTGHQFWWAPEGVTSIDVLIVAGGGGGGDGGDTGGGGAGGLIFYPNMPIKDQDFYEVEVGAGGDPAQNGEPSRFDQLVAIGGGAGSPDFAINGNHGGSGGGAGGYSGNGGVALQPIRQGGAGRYGFGNPGGSNRGHGGLDGMGGGGAGAPGTDAININAAIKHGGDGLCKVGPNDGPYDTIYHFVNVFDDRYGQKLDGEIWFAGGGGGGGEQGTKEQNTGGKGGGGDGGHLDSGKSRYGYNGQHNTGGGGGGGDNHQGGHGGNGIVLIAYNNPLTNQEGYKYDSINTIIDVYPLPGQPVKGKATFYYRRLDVGNIFKNKIIYFDRWTPSNAATTQDICNWLNLEYGTEFVADDFPNQTFPSSETVRTLTVNSDSYAYIGFFQFVYDTGKRSLDQLLDSYTIDGVDWDLKHGGAEDNRPLMSFIGYGVDYSDLLYVINAISSGTTISAGGPIELLVERFNALFETELDASISHTEPNGLAGLRATRYTLPNTGIDEANSSMFNNALALSSTEASWFGGNIIFHYNPK